VEFEHLGGQALLICGSRLMVILRWPGGGQQVQTRGLRGSRYGLC